MWACAFRATFISSISFIYLLILLYSHSFSKHCHSLHRETFEEEAQNPFPKHVARSHVRLLRTPRANTTTKHIARSALAPPHVRLSKSQNPLIGTPLVFSKSTPTEHLLTSTSGPHI